MEYEIETTLDNVTSLEMYALAANPLLSAEVDGDKRTIRLTYAKTKGALLSLSFTWKR